MPLIWLSLRRFASQFSLEVNICKVHRMSWIVSPIAFVHKLCHAKMLGCQTLSGHVLYPIFTCGTLLISTQDFPPSWRNLWTSSFFITNWIQCPRYQIEGCNRSHKIWMNAQNQKIKTPTRFPQLVETPLPLRTDMSNFEFRLVEY